MIRRLCVIGVGLIGGSLALALRRAGYCSQIVGAGRHAETLERARDLGVIDGYDLDFAQAVGGADMVVLAVPMLDRFKIDDVVGAIPVHLIAGFWGTLVVPVYTEGTSFVTQIAGFGMVGLFVFVASLAVWQVLKATLGVRVSEEAEIAGLDMSELGMEAYPEFAKG